MWNGRRDADHQQAAFERLPCTFPDRAVRLAGELVLLRQRQLLAATPTRLRYASVAQGAAIGRDHCCHPNVQKRLQKNAGWSLSRVYFHPKACRQCRAFIATCPVIKVTSAAPQSDHRLESPASRATADASLPT